MYTLYHSNSNLFFKSSCELWIVRIFKIYIWCLINMAMWMNVCWYFVIHDLYVGFHWYDFLCVWFLCDIAKLICVWEVRNHTIWEYEYNFCVIFNNVRIPTSEWFVCGISLIWPFCDFLCDLGSLFVCVLNPKVWIYIYNFVWYLIYCELILICCKLWVRIVYLICV